MSRVEMYGMPVDHAVWTLPKQPVRKRDGGRQIGWLVAAAGCAAVLTLAVFRLTERRASQQPQLRRTDEARAAQQLAGGAAILAFSVLADSGIEHYRGAFHNPAMYVAPTVSAVSLAHHVHMAMTPELSTPSRLGLSGLTLATGIAGFAFHVYNVAKRDGGLRLFNLFYGAPLGAPAAIAASGLAGLAAVQLVAEAKTGEMPTLLRRPAGTVLGLGAAGVLVGTVAEAALLHFRGAFHNPFMFVPVTIPPVAAAALAAATGRPRWREPARALLYLTAAAGVIGAGFHAYGVSRNMGGFYNWSQNILNGPPLPAPPSFTGAALAGLAAVRLMAAA